MRLRHSDQVIVGAAAIYLVVLAVAMGRVSYDVWGALIVGPVLAVLGYVVVRRMFRGELAPLANVMLVGLAVKGAGTLARHAIAFGAYGGATDAQRYHREGRIIASRIWQGRESLWSIVPTGRGTPFMENLTGSVYVFTGSSRLAGYFVLSFLSYLGVLWFVKAACLAVPGLLRRRYAVLCVVAPSLVYWPSSIGKEAWMMLTLGLGTYGIALLLTRRQVLRPVLVVALGLGGAAVVRPHIAGLWLAALLPAVLVAGLRGRGPKHIRHGGFTDRLMLVVVAVLAVIAVGAVGSATMRYFQYDESEGVTSTAITDILTETTRRTSEAGSFFRPPSVDSPADWPFAVVRTLVRPLPIEARGMAQLVSAAELMALWVLCLANLRRVLQAPRLVFSNPFVAFSLSVLVFGCLAYTSFANLGVLTRQKSLLFPALLLVPCLPLPASTRGDHPAVAAVQEPQRLVRLVPTR